MSNSKQTTARQVFWTALAALALTLGATVPVGAATDNEDVYYIADGSALGNGAHTTLNRNNVSVHAHLRNMPVGHAVTIWTVVFEHPENCVDGCGDDDVDAAFGGSNAPDITIFNGGGGVVNKAGVLNISAALGGGDSLIGDATIDNPATAEVHFIVRSHGPDQPGDDDTTTYLGGCTTELPFGSIPSAVGECGDFLFSVHMA